eukprot:CAMPEP_0114555854 /NCGR_PEP_ID=MMETSP0114-20121206/8972_1 /TAXON_ID=31324 /ORGANISM="Goniomonas sp, Strain m" /LENGTH=503 /DNA_ID=CAMNT_0001741009 /DNA_START=35 /DNA_END=1546 /DNA_ORIENTATION=+
MSYQGQKKGRVRHGVGCYTYPNAFFRYEGDWQDGKKHGKGTLFLGDGSSFEGDFVCGEIEGFGLKRWPNGSTYSGEFQGGEMHGQGVYLAADGGKYEGGWKHNCRHGAGSLVLPDGTQLQGTFENHQLEGEGTMHCADGSYYEGGWHRGKMSGHGLLHSASGDAYEGNWLEGMRHGEGRFFSSHTSMSYDCMWVKDAPAVLPTRLAAYPLDAPDRAAGTTSPTPRSHSLSAGAPAGAPAEEEGAEHPKPPTLAKLLKEPLKSGDQLPKFVVKVENDEGYTCDGEAGRLVRIYFSKDSISEEEMTELNNLCLAAKGAKVPATKGKGDAKGKKGAAAPVTDAEEVDEVWPDPGEVPLSPFEIIFENLNEGDHTEPESTSRPVTSSVTGEATSPSGEPASVWPPPAPENGGSPWKSHFPPQYVVVRRIDEGELDMGSIRLPMSLPTGRYTLRIGQAIEGPFGPVSPIILKVKVLAMAEEALAAAPAKGGKAAPTPKAAAKKPAKKK